MRLKYSPCPKCRDNGKDSRGDNAVCYPDGSEHCFSCGYHKFPLGYVHKEREVIHGAKSLLPADFTWEVPATAWQWVLQYGMPWSTWKASCGYSPGTQRLVFRVESEGILHFSIGRYVGDDHQNNRKWYVWGDCHKHCHVLFAGEATRSGVVLVEDLISANKVALVANAIPLFGTKIHPCHMYYLQNSDGPVYLWLDKDQELAVKKQAARLSALIGKDIRVISTNDDPKCLSAANIEKELA